VGDSISADSVSLFAVIPCKGHGGVEEEEQRMQNAKLGLGTHNSPELVPLFLLFSPPDEWMTEGLEEKKREILSSHRSV
jgi:hypothetical protein